MNRQTVKTLSSVALWAGTASVLISGGLYVADLIRGTSSGKRREGSIFVGLWAPSLFALAEMFDRVSEQDERFMGMPITDRGAQIPITEKARELIRR